MLGEPSERKELKMVSQAAWVRSLTSTYVKPETGRRITIGGLFGTPLSKEGRALPWSRAQQAAFLITAWQKMAEAVKKAKLSWAEQLRGLAKESASRGDLDPAFAGPFTLLNTDQGVRGFLYVTNDLTFLRARELQLERWEAETPAGAVDEQAVTSAVRSISRLPIAEFLGSIASSLAKFDWRASSFPPLTEDERERKLVFRGSSGYKELRRQLLKSISSESGILGELARRAQRALGYGETKK